MNAHVTVVARKNHIYGSFDTFTFIGVDTLDNFNGSNKCEQNTAYEVAPQITKEISTVSEKENK